MALTANFIADFSSFTDATKDAVTAMQGFKESAVEMGTAADRSLEERQKQAEQIGRAARRVGEDALAASSVFIKAYADEQAAVQHLTTALEATGNATPAVIKAYADMAGEFQKSSRFADEAITEVQAKLTTLGHVAPDQMKPATEATLNLATVLKVDLATAAGLMAKSVQEGGEPVKKIKDLLGDAYKPGMSAAEMFEAINKKTGKAYQDDLKTYDGAMDNLNNTLGEFHEQVGKVLVDTLNDMLKAFKGLPDGVQTFVIGVVAIGTVLAPLMVSLAALVSVLGATGIGAAIGTAITFIGSLIASFVALVGWPVLIGAAVVALGVVIYKNWDAIAAATAALYTSVKTWLVDKFWAIVAGIKGVTDAIVNYFRDMWNKLVGHSIVPDLITGIGDQFAQLDRLMVDPVRAATRDAMRAFTGLSASAPSLTAGLNVGALAGGGAAGATVVNISMTGMLGANDPQTRQAITQVVGDALAASMRGQRLLSSA